MMCDLNVESYPPSKLDEYNVVDEIEGAFGQVKMAYHTITRRKVVMKFLSKEAIIASHVQREVDYMRMLRHPHIIRLYEVISTPTDIIIVLEYAGVELFKYIVDNGRIPEPQARRFFQQMISGIDYIHRLGIVHRDLKPENILLDDGLNVKIADFGLSNEIEDGDFFKTICGSPNYAAPEVIRGAQNTGPKVDVWTSGVVLYVMLCGRLPFENEDIGLPDYLSDDARSLINGMLHVDPEKRLTIADVRAHPWFTPDLPQYLLLLPPPGPVVDTLSSRPAPPEQLDFEIEGQGRMEEDVVEELAQRFKGVTVGEGGLEGGAVSTSGPVPAPSVPAPRVSTPPTPITPELRISFDFMSRLDAYMFAASPPLPPPEPAPSMSAPPASAPPEPPITPDFMSTGFDDFTSMFGRDDANIDFEHDLGWFSSDTMVSDSLSRG